MSLLVAGVFVVFVSVVAAYYLLRPGGAFPFVVAAPWSPGGDPHPSAILDEAKADATSGRYAEALAKHVWFFENALKYAPSMSGVRLSFALSDWKTLSDSYPPALEKLKSERDEAAAKVRGSKDSRHSFNDFASINRELCEDAKTRELFLWLDANSPATASAVYDLAQPSLVKATEYVVCGRYLVDPDRSLERMVWFYREHQKTARDSEFRREMSDFADKSLSNGVGTLIALLVVNGRTADANRVADGAMKVRDDTAFRARIESALRGEVPPPWP
ncbi:MAG: hypothetical protein NEA02_13365 [Thermoanaerobaculia bacterium]|nr:hypothetical protein [Thermoanaerobaculia bacterium]